MKKDNVESLSNELPIWVFRSLRISRAAFVLGFILQIPEMCAPLSVSAVSYVPVPLYHRQEKLEYTMKTGDTVYLFHSGTADVRRGIKPGDVLMVHRINSSCEVREVGKIKVMSYSGENYIKAEVIEGEVKADDIAKKGDVSFLVIFAGICNYEK